MRVVLHAHSIWSYDGKWRLESIARLFGRLGVDAVMMTEHDTGFDPSRFQDYRQACRDASTASCTLVPGIEYSSPDNSVHVLTWGLDHFLAEHRPVDETLERVAVAGGAAILAHPARQGAHRLFDPAWTDRLHGIELWNRKTDGLTHGQAALELIGRTGLAATVGVDFHRLRNLWPLSHRFDAIVSGVDPEAHLVAALRCGRHRPEVFGRSLLDREGKPASAIHSRLDRSRRAVLNTIRRR
jgi:predicted metal-dependent phosphoesterase TrpH